MYTIYKGLFVSLKWVNISDKKQLTHETMNKNTTKENINTSKQ